MPGGEFAKLKIESKEIDNLKSFYSEIEQIIKKVKVLRDRVFAHFDRTIPPEVFEDELTPNEMETLLVFVRFFLKKLSELGTGGNGFVHTSFEYEGKGKKMLSDVTNNNNV